MSEGKAGGVDVPVLIVGGGPVGLGLASDSGWRGVEWLLVEKRDGTIYHSRAETQNCRKMEFCRRWGIADNVRAAGTSPDFLRTVAFFTSLAGFVPLRLGGEVANSAGLEESARTRGVPFTAIDVAEPEIRALYERRLVLVRPDGHIAWCGDTSPADPVAVLDRLRGTG